MPTTAAHEDDPAVHATSVEPSRADRAHAGPAPSEHGDGAYRKDMAGVDWGQVYAHQMRRAELAASWIAQLAVRPGDRVLDAGSGPGYFSLLLAEAVGSPGVVYAVDRSPDALAYLHRLQQERGLPQIRCIASDVTVLRLEDGPVDAALVTMMLHHADDPAALLANVAQLLRPGGRAVVAEFHPEGPAEPGPPPAERIAPATARRWCEAADLQIQTEERPTPSFYALLAERR